MRADQLAHFGGGGHNGAFTWAPYPGVMFLKIGTTVVDNAVISIKAYNTTDHGVWDINADVEVDPFEGFELRGYRASGAPFVLAASV